MKKLFVYPVLSVLGVLMSVAPAFALGPDATKKAKAYGLSASDIAKVDAGKIVTKGFPKKGGEKAEHYAAFGLYKNTTGEKAMAILLDATKFPEYFPHVVECKIEAKEGNVVTLKYILSIALKKIHYTVRVDHSPKQVKWTMLKDKKHDIADTYGSWYFVQDGANLFVVYDVHTDTGMAVPAFIEKMLTKQDLPSVVKALRTRHNKVYGGTH